MTHEQRSHALNDPFAELVIATQEFMAARAKMLKLVLAVAQLQGDLPAPEPAAEPAKRGGRRKQRSDRAKLDGVTEYWKKGVCDECGLSVGTRVMNGKRFPVNHKDPKTDLRCNGVFKQVLTAEPGPKANESD